MFAEGFARLLLVLHTALAVAAVGAATHLVLWLRPYLRGAYTRQRAVRRFGVIAAVLYVATFVVGNLVYPTYKVRVKVEYFQNPTAIVDATADRLRAAAEVEARYHKTAVVPVEERDIERASADLPQRADKMARWFDTKEHWVAIGVILSLGCMVLLLAWDPRRDGPAAIPYIYLLSVGACAALWLGAIIGVITASWRAIG